MADPVTDDSDAFPNAGLQHTLNGSILGTFERQNSWSDGSIERQLLLAALQGDAKEVRRWLSLGASIDCTNSRGQTPLFLAVSAPVPRAFNALLRASADVEVKDSDGWTPLMMACRMCKPQAVAELIAHGACVNDQSIGGKSPLMLAASVCSIDVVSLLCAKLADVNASNKKGFTPLFFAIESKQASIVTYLTMHPDLRPRVAHDGKTPLIFACWANVGVGVVQAIVQSKADLHAQDAAGDTALMASLRNENVEVPRSLLRASASVLQKNKAGETCVDIAQTFNVKGILHILEKRQGKNTKDAATCSLFEDASVNLSSSGFAQAVVSALPPCLRQGMLMFGSGNWKMSLQQQRKNSKLSPRQQRPVEEPPSLARDKTRRL